MEKCRHLWQASCFSKGTWLFGAFAVFSTGKSEVKTLVGRSDSSGAESNAAEDGYKWIIWGQVRDANRTWWWSLSPLSSPGKLLLLDEISPISEEIHRKSPSSLSWFVIFWISLLSKTCLWRLFGVAACLARGLSLCQTCPPTHSPQGPTMGGCNWNKVIKLLWNVLNGRTHPSPASDLQPFGSYLVSWKIPHRGLQFVMGWLHGFCAATSLFFPCVVAKWLFGS